MRLLLVTWHFPPVNTIAGIRLGKLARFLDHAGHDVRILTVDLPGTDRSLPVEIAADRVTRAPFWDHEALLDPRRWFRRGRSSSTAGRGGAAAPGPDPGRPPPGRAAALARDIYRGIVTFPDKQVGWARHLAPRLGEMLAEFRPDAVLASGPPFSPFLCVSRLCRKRGIPWIADLRDRWADDTYTAIPDWRRPMDQWLERRTMRTAAGLVTVSQPWADAFRAKYGKPVATIMNGYDPADFPAPDEAGPSGLPLRIVHVGSIYEGRRDPTPLFSAIRAGGFEPDSLKVVFRGRHLEWVRQLGEAQGVTPFLEFREPVPYADAIRIQQTADILLLLQWNAPSETGNVPGKVFEYMAARRPILGLGPQGGVPATLIAERGAGLFSNDPGEIASRLRLWLDEKASRGRIEALPAENCAGLTRDEQYARLESFLADIVATHRRGLGAGIDGNASHVAQAIER
jgi:glycosyltransferase involved in cell wall biosynthesis